MPTLSKLRKVLLITAGSVVVLIAIFYLFLNYWANNRLADILGDKVQSKNVDVRIIGNQVTFDDPSVVMDGSQNESGFRLDASANYILIDGFDIWDLLFSNEIDVNLFVVDSLQVQMVLPGKERASSQKEQVNLFVQNIFSQINVSHFEIRKSDFVFRKAEDNDTLYAVNGFNLAANGIIIDTATVDRPFPLHFDSSTFRIDKALLNLGDYTLTANNLVKEGLVFVTDNIRFVSIYTQEEFVAKNKYEKSRIDLSVDSLKIKSLFWDIKKGSLKLDAEKLELERMVLDVYKDKGPPQEPPATVPLLTTSIKELPLTITVDTTSVKDSYIEYEQKPSDVDSTGVVKFANLYATIYNLTNDSVRIDKSPVTTLDAVSKFMHAGELNVKIQLLMNTSDGGFTASGKLGPMDLSQLNVALLPLIGAKLEGQVNELTFDFKGDNRNSEGSLDFYYENLDISLMNKNSEKAWFKSLLGDAVLRSQNKPEDEKHGEVYFVRYQNKSIWNYLWHSIRVGIIDVVVPVYSPAEKERLLSDQPKYMEDK